MTAESRVAAAHLLRGAARRERTTDGCMVRLGKVVAGSHSFSRCMERGCRKAPEVECVWADGRGRAWFCRKHFDAWSKENADEGISKDIVKQRKVPAGVVGERYGECPEHKTAADGDPFYVGQVVVCGPYSGADYEYMAGTIERAQIQSVDDHVLVRMYDGRLEELDPDSVSLVPDWCEHQADQEREGDDLGCIPSTALSTLLVQKRRERNGVLELGSMGWKERYLETCPELAEVVEQVADLMDRSERREITEPNPLSLRPDGEPDTFLRVAKATGRKTGDGHGVGLFIPLPKRLAKKFPSLGENDDSPSHVTFLYIGDFQGDEAEQEHLVDTLRGILKRWWPGAKATLGPVDKFVHEDKDRVVPHVTVDFDKDLSGFRHRVKQELLEAGFEVDDKFPEYKPHVTLAYLPGLDAEWKGRVPKGSWEFDEMEVWGLPKVHKIKLGPSIHKVSRMWLDRRLAQAAVKTGGWWCVEDEDVPCDGPVTGDGPADHTDEWMDQLDIIYRVSRGRPATPEEIEATFNFVFRPVQDGSVKLNPWFDEFVEWLGLPATEITWPLEVWGAISWFFLQMRNRGSMEESTAVAVANLGPPLPDVWETLGVVKDDLLRLNALEYPGDTDEGRKFLDAVMDKLDVLQAHWMNVEFQRDLDEAERSLVERISERWLGKVASRIVESATHKRNVALMKWLAELARRLGVARDTYVVGGAVRNFLIDRPIKDIDIVIDTTKAGKDSDWLARQVARAIPAPTNVTTNQYGVAILTVKGDWMMGGENLRGEVLEIANARKESYGGDVGKGYKPHTVAPATIEEDVLRREFTFNSLLWRMLDLAKGPDKAEVIDLTGCGRRDLEERTLQCPRDPDVVFSDDPTRMLRAIKFTGKYGFKIPPDLARSIRRNADKMKRMPWEAIASILVGDVLSQPTARKSLVQMKKLGLLDVVSEMIQEEKAFATFMANQLRRNRRVSLLLDLMDLGVPAQTPIHFLDRSGQQRLREITVAMPEDQAAAFVNVLIKPPVDNRRVIDVLELPPAARRDITPTARHLILQDPELAARGGRLTDRVIEELRR